MAEEYRIGTGGWAYFYVGSRNKLHYYSKIFNFVEVNTTYYNIPSFETVNKWRNTVPQDFYFSVRANKLIAEKYKFAHTNLNIELLEKIVKICNILKSDLLHFYIPKHLELESEFIQNFSNLIGSVNLSNIKIVLEFSKNLTPINKQIIKFMQENNIVHCVDLSKDQKPIVKNDVVYTRLFGKGKHNIYQFSDEDLIALDKKVVSINGVKKVVFAFHVVKMYMDALRYKHYKEQGKFIPVTKYRGIESLKYVLEEDLSFPCNKEKIIEKCGWKLFDLNDEKRIRVSEIIKYLPNMSFSNLNELLEVVKELDIFNKL